MTVVNYLFWGIELKGDASRQDRTVTLDNGTKLDGSDETQIKWANKLPFNGKLGPQKGLYWVALDNKEDYDLAKERVPVVVGNLLYRNNPSCNTLVDEMPEIDRSELRRGDVQLAADINRVLGMEIEPGQIREYHVRDIPD